MGVVKFKTSGRTIPMLRQTGNARIMHEDAEFGIDESQLNQIEREWNGGIRFEDLVEQVGRPWDEIMFALMELAKEERLTRPIAYRCGN